MSRIRKWRTNYIIIFQNRHFAKIYRKPVHELLTNLALVRGIDCKVKCEYPFAFEPTVTESEFLKDIQADLLYFRSSRHTKIRGVDFRKLVDKIFEEQQMLGFGKYPFEVTAQMQKFLNDYPYPDD